MPRKGRVVEVARYQLTDSSLRVTKLGRRYQVARLWADGWGPEGTGPALWEGLSKSEAAQVVADLLRADVLEL